jgi:hypothetical protein
VSSDLFENLYSSVIPIAVIAPSGEFPLTVSACDLDEPSGKLLGKLILIDAIVWHVAWNKEGSEDFVLVEPLPSACSGFDPSVTTELDLRNYSGPNKNLESRLGRFKREVDIQIVGKVKMSEKGYPEVLYRIVPENIKIISTWRRFTPKGAA